jgi:hypothetical protein
MSESQLRKIIRDLQDEISALKRKIKSIETRNYKIDLKRKFLK